MLKDKVDHLIATLRSERDLEVASSYGEPGYADPGNGVLLADWNDVPQETQNLLEQGGYALEWSDEWCVAKGKAYRTEPDSYFWEPSVRYSVQDGDWMTPEYLYDWIHECRIGATENDLPVANLPSWFPVDAILGEGYELMEADLRGVFDESSARALAEKHLAAGAEYVLFQRAKQSQSYFHYRVFCKNPDVKGSIIGTLRK